MCLVFIVLAIISYSVPFYSPTTLQHASRLDSKTLLTKFIWTIFSTYGGRFFPFFIFGWPFFFRGRFFLYSSGRDVRA